MDNKDLMQKRLRISLELFKSFTELAQTFLEEGELLETFKIAHIQSIAVNLLKNLKIWTPENLEEIKRISKELNLPYTDTFEKLFTGEKENE